jgi:hypothetical protein
MGFGQIQKNGKGNGIGPKKRKMVESRKCHQIPVGCAVLTAECFVCISLPDLLWILVMKIAILVQFCREVQSTNICMAQLAQSSNLAKQQLPMKCRETCGKCEKGNWGEYYYFLVHT